MKSSRHRAAAARRLGARGRTLEARLHALPARCRATGLRDHRSHSADRAAAGRAPAAKRKRIRLSDLAGERFVSLKLHNEPKTRDFFRQDCLRAGFEPNVILEAEQLEVMLAMVAAGLGVACTPDLVRSLPFPGVAMVALTPLIHGVFTAVWDPRVLSPAAANFLAILRAAQKR